jgi:hypothetical protein
VPPWAPFLRFGVPGLFGSPFLTRPNFGGPPLPHGLNGMVGLNGNGGSPHSSVSPQRNMQGPPSEDSNDERGMFRCFILNTVGFFANPNVFIIFNSFFRFCWLCCTLHACNLHFCIFKYVNIKLKSWTCNTYANR